MVIISKKSFMSRSAAVILLSSFATIQSWAGIVRGTIYDQENNEPLYGATVQLAGTDKGVITDLDGNYELIAPNGTYSLLIKYVGYQDVTLPNIKITDKTPALADAQMQPESQSLGNVMVVAEVKRNTETAMIAASKQSLIVQSGVSVQQIQKTQDRDASEVIRRIPGISIIDDKFVMVRGLSQRYNNVWINGSSVPSSEADSRAFSFDIIPSSQLDNMVIVKSPSPEYPADFSGGFILINTKEVPNKNSFSITLGGNYNNCTHGRKFLYNEGSSTDWLGFDDGKRQLNGGIHSTLKSIAGNGIDLNGNGFNNDWTVKDSKPLADMNISANMNRFWNIGDNTMALMAALNYSNSYKSFSNMENSLMGAYDTANDCSNYLRQSTDNQYNHNIRTGAMVNLTFIPSNSNHRFEFKNIFNQLGKSRYTYRIGTNAQNDKEESAEYYYSSRTTYNGQFTGKHSFDEGKLDWSTGYAYANRSMPDRRRYLLNDKLESGVIGLTSGNDLSREYTQLDEHIFSANMNYERELNISGYKPTIKAGAFGEYRTREYYTRNFIYNWNYGNNTLPSDFRYLDLPTQLLTEENCASDKLYLLEEVKWRNNYQGNNMLAAGYISGNLPLGDFNIYAGVRYEHNDMELISNTRDYEESHKNTHYKDDDFFPSINTTYKLNDEHQVRLSYGKSVNRPEFREVSSSVYYDFDLASDVQGNTSLEACYIQNFDFRYEWYPNRGEQISLALFYKHFDSPIEWTYTVTGGTDLTYSYQNAEGADNYGIELDIRKNLGFMGLPQLDWTFNGSLIKSKVQFADDSNEKDRPMQGQSPYLVNTGLFYSNEANTLSFGLLYNRIGKRIVGVGRSVGTTGGDDTANIPHSYEMPRNVFDFTASYKPSQHWELKASARDILAENVNFKQFTDATHRDGSNSTVEEVTKSYKPGRNFSLSVSYNF